MVNYKVNQEWATWNRNKAQAVRILYLMLILVVSNFTAWSFEMEQSILLLVKWGSKILLDRSIQPDQLYSRKEKKTIIMWFSFVNLIIDLSMLDLTCLLYHSGPDLGGWICRLIVSGLDQSYVILLTNLDCIHNYINRKTYNSKKKSLRTLDILSKPPYPLKTTILIHLPPGHVLLLNVHDLRIFL